MKNKILMLTLAAGLGAGGLLAFNAPAQTTDMRELSPADQIVITLQEIEGRSVREISQLTGSSGVAVRVRALRARAKLRKAIQKLEGPTP